MRSFLRFLLRALLVLLVVLVVAALVWREQAVAQLRAVAVLAEILQVPVLQPAVRVATREPREPYETRLGPVDATVFQPTGDGPWPAIVLITGADAAGRKQPDLVRAARGLVRAGYVVYVPDTPDLRAGTLGSGTVDATAETILAAARDRHAEGRRVGVVAVSAGASLALVAAARPELRDDRLTGVVAVAPFAEARTVAMLATTGHYRDRAGEIRPYDADPRLRELLARSVLAAARDQGTPESVVDGLEARVDEADDPLEPFAELAGVTRFRLPLPRRLVTVVELLANRDPEQFDERYDALDPELRTALEELSPLRTAGDVTAPVEILAPPRDTYFPLDESRRLEEGLPDARLTVTPVLDHAIPQGTGSLRDLGGLDAAVVRALDDFDG